MNSSERVERPYSKCTEGCLQKKGMIRAADAKYRVKLLRRSLRGFAFPCVSLISQRQCPCRIPGRLLSSKSNLEVMRQTVSAILHSFDITCKLSINSHGLITNRIRFTCARDLFWNSFINGRNSVPFFCIVISIGISFVSTFAAVNVPETIGTSKTQMTNVACVRAQANVKYTVKNRVSIC